LMVAIGGDRGRVRLLGMIGCMIGGLTAGPRGCIAVCMGSYVCPRESTEHATRFESNELYCMDVGRESIVSICDGYRIEYMYMVVMAFIHLYQEAAHWPLRNSTSTCRARCGVANPLYATRLEGAGSGGHPAACPNSEFPDPLP